VSFPSIAALPDYRHILIDKHPVNTVLDQRLRHHDRVLGIARRNLLKIAWAILMVRVGQGP
jgi:hypothetical protein